MSVKLNDSSKYFIQKYPEIKNNPQYLVLQEKPTKDGLLTIKFPKLTCWDNELSS